MRTIIVKKDGLQYVEVATQETLLQKIARGAAELGAAIDRILFATDLTAQRPPQEHV